MAAQHLSRITAILAAALVVFPAAGLLDAHAAAQSSRAQLPINVEAASFEGNMPNNSVVYHDVIISQGDVRVQAAKASVVGGINYENSKWTLSGDVRINAGNGSLRSDEAIIYFANNLLTRATITGTPAQFEQQREGGAEPARGHANTIDYETSTGSVSLKNEAWLSDGCNEIRGEKLVYNIRSQSVQAQSVAAAPGSTGNGRIRITIQPQTPSGKPCATPGKKP
jgi:lipopolysaccharide transport protein LptA